MALAQSGVSALPRCTTLRLARNDWLVLATDGVAETLRGGMSQLRDCLQASGDAAVAVLNVIEQTERSARDDRSVVVLRRLQ